MPFIGDFARYDFDARGNVWERERFIQVSSAQPHGAQMTVLVEVYASQEDVEPPRRTPPITQEYFEVDYNESAGRAVEQAEAWMAGSDRFENLAPVEVA